MARHRGTYKPDHPEPYEISRSKIEGFIKCPACFYMDRVLGIKFPSIFGFNINEATDVLLKRDFEKYREQQLPHPFLVQAGMGHLVPFRHEEFHKWTVALQLGLRTAFEPAHFIVGGGLDDVWLNQDTEKIHVVEYKSTSSKKPGKKMTVEDPWKISYRRQVELYQWILRRNGFDVSDTVYFLYCDGDRFDDRDFLRQEDAVMQFKMSLFEYEGDDSWVEDTLLAIKETLLLSHCPEHAQTGFGLAGNLPCEYGILLKGAKDQGL